MSIPPTGGERPDDDPETPDHGDPWGHPQSGDPPAGHVPPENPSAENPPADGNYPSPEYPPPGRPPAGAGYPPPGYAPPGYPPPGANYLPPGYPPPGGGYPPHSLPVSPPVYGYQVPAGRSSGSQVGAGFGIGCGAQALQFLFMASSLWAVHLWGVVMLAPSLIGAIVCLFFANARYYGVGILISIAVAWIVFLGPCMALMQM